MLSFGDLDPMIGGRQTQKMNHSSGVIVSRRSESGSSGFKLRDDVRAPIREMPARPSASLRLTQSSETQTDSRNQEMEKHGYAILQRRRLRRGHRSAQLSCAPARFPEHQAPHRSETCRAKHW